jgi:hypothetical protein
MQFSLQLLGGVVEMPKLFFNETSLSSACLAGPQSSFSILPSLPLLLTLSPLAVAFQLLTLLPICRY